MRLLKGCRKPRLKTFRAFLSATIMSFCVVSLGWPELKKIEISRSVERAGVVIEGDVVWRWEVGGGVGMDIKVKRNKFKNRKKHERCG